MGRTFTVQNVDGSHGNLELFKVDGLKCLARNNDLARAAASTMCTWFFVLLVDKETVVMTCDRFMSHVAIGQYKADGLKKTGGKADGEA